MRQFRVLGVVAVLATIISSAAVAARGGLGFPDWEWTLVSGDAPWARRAGMQVVELRDRLYLMGGRTPLPSPIPGASVIWDDIWASDDQGGEHVVVHEGLEPVDESRTYPRCASGEGRCPPEDCGGPHGYVEFLLAYVDPNHEQHESMVQ